MSANELLTQLLPVLGKSEAVGFNVFDVMHHGTHEKQLSNIFRWIFEIGGTHNFEGLGQDLFVEVINEELGEGLPAGPYTVRQEVNTAKPGLEWDIADIVLESDSAVIVVENYGTSDGHGHEYEGYLEFGRRGGKRSVVVLLCGEEDRALQTDGWENAPVVTYERLLDRLIRKLDDDSTYAKRNAEQYTFLSQVHRKFSKGKARMSDKDVLDFITAMCATGEARRYQERDRDVAAERLASDLAQQARERYGESRDVLQHVKSRLLTYVNGVLKGQLNAAFGEGRVERVVANHQGIYQWAVILEPAPGHDASGSPIQIKLGPSAWFVNEQEPTWRRKVDPRLADYSRLFLTYAGNHEVRQSAVTLHEVLYGLDAGDTRLLDEIVALVRGE
ncbi:hypothetical protein GCM10009860_15520 [Microbacterium mitrae]|uniref:PD-(D/E)XK nuclease superfamily protein n=1 Tax=Microbacterium mitrae TaxID=664640 RepID=A0A5C8HMA8_9MICO|nr:PD-(D/E)XK nuclease family protein [Microbacterium mitrae]TXK03372.1 hypothetical protein FVP60_10800 [Microbacterium mitrae]